MKIEHSIRQHYIVLTMTGRLDLAAAPRIQQVLLKHLSDQPPALICDLSGVEAIDPVCAGVFTAVRHRASNWPATSLVLCCARPAVADLLTQLRVPHFLPLYQTLDQALAHARARPPYLREQLRLGPVPKASSLARAFAGEVCERWRLNGLAEPAMLLASELVTNAVVHAGTPLELRLELRWERLTIAVRDQDPNIVNVLRPEDDAGREHGLGIVDWYSRTWGVRRDPAGGKVVWCVLDRPEPLGLPN